MAVTIIQEIICHEIIYDPYHANTINLKVTIYPLRSFGYTAESIWGKLQLLFTLTVIYYAAIYRDNRHSRSKPRVMLVHFLYSSKF